MDVIPKFIVIAAVAAALLFGLYAGIRTAVGALWFVEWRNRLNGDPRDYAIELRSYRWARWNLMIWNPDLVRTSPSLLWQHRGFGIVLAVMSAVSLIIIGDLCP